MCVGAPRPDTSSRLRRARRVKSAAHFLARRERSHAQVRPSLTGEASMASTCLFDAPEHRGTRPGWAWFMDRPIALSMSFRFCRSCS